MAKQRRELRNGKSGEEIVLSTGVTVTVLPFPLGLLERINKDFPDPKPPKKTINVLGGTEEVDNLTDPDYLAQKQLTTNQRNAKLGEATIEFCIECDLSQYESTIRRLEKIVSSYPDDPYERRARFLQDYALATVNDYSNVMVSSISQATVTDEEVTERIATFQGDLSRHTTNGTPTPGPDEIERLDVVEPVA